MSIARVMELYSLLSRVVAPTKGLLVQPNLVHASSCTV